MKNKNLISLILLFSVSFISSYAAAADNIRWIAQNYAPYSYTDKDGNNIGLAIDVAELLTKEMNSSDNSQNIELVNLTKFFVFRNNDANTVFFPIVKTKEREERFKWVGPIAKVNPVLIAKKINKIKVEKPIDLNKYSIAAMNGFFAINKLKKTGVDNKTFEAAENDLEALKELHSNEVDLVLCAELSCNFSIESLKLNPNEYEVVYSLEGEESFDFAFSTDTKDEVIARVNKALNKIKANKNGKISEYDKIIDKYTK